MAAAGDMSPERVKQMFSWTQVGWAGPETSPTAPPTDEKETKIGHVQFSKPFETQQSTIWQKRQQAVCVRHAFKHYGSKKRPNHVLSNLNMTVAKGTIDPGAVVPARLRSPRRIGYSLPERHSVGEGCLELRQPNDSNL